MGFRLGECDNGGKVGWDSWILIWRMDEVCNVKVDRCLDMIFK